MLDDVANIPVSYPWVNDCGELQDHGISRPGLYWANGGQIKCLDDGWTRIYYWDVKKQRQDYFQDDLKTSVNSKDRDEELWIGLERLARSVTND